MFTGPALAKTCEDPRCKSLGLIEASQCIPEPATFRRRIRGVKASASLKPLFAQRETRRLGRIRGVKASASLKRAVEYAIPPRDLRDPRCKSLGLIEASFFLVGVIVFCYGIRGVKASASLKPHPIHSQQLRPRWIRGVKASASLKPA